MFLVYLNPKKELKLIEHSYFNHQELEDGGIKDSVTFNPNEPYLILSIKSDKFAEIEDMSPFLSNYEILVISILSTFPFELDSKHFRVSPFSIVSDKPLNRG